MAALKKQPKLDPKRLKMAQVFRGSGAESVGLAFHRRGQWCVSATGDDPARDDDAAPSTYIVRAGVERTRSPERLSATRRRRV